MLEHCRAEKLKCPIWLLGDSLPNAWEGKVKGPFDPRYPTRQSIWTPVWDEIQATVYPRRVDGKRLYICNAAVNVNAKPDWNFDGTGLKDRIGAYREALSTYRPCMVLAFGQRAFEFARRASGEDLMHNPTYWDCRKLGDEFRKRVDSFDPCKVNVFPLLHAVIARGHWWQAHDYFTNVEGGNYFECAGRALGILVKRHLEKCDIWAPATENWQSK
jgi:hypothetical protein